MCRKGNLGYRRELHVLHSLNIFSMSPVSAQLSCLVWRQQGEFKFIQTRTQGETLRAQEEEDENYVDGN